MTAWRPEDEALLQHLEDQRALQVLVLAQLGRAEVASIHPRAAGLVHLARSRERGELAVRAALRGDGAALAELLATDTLEQAPPAFVHHLALYAWAIGNELAERAPERASAFWLRALEAWWWLAKERAYVCSVATSVAGPGAKETPAPDPAFPLSESLEELGRQAESTLRDLAARGRAALLALASFEARLAVEHADQASSMRRAVTRIRSRVVDEALGLLGEALDDASARDRATTEGAVHLRRVVDVWSWSNHDDAVPPFLLERLSPLAWDVYRTRDRDRLRALLDPYRELVDTFASAVEVDPSKLAYAAVCAQMYVFLSDVAEGVEAKRVLAERAVKVCPTHRNGRVILAALLCDTALELMQHMRGFAPKKDTERVEAMLDRAERMHPETSGLAEAREELRKVRRHVVGG